MKWVKVAIGAVIAILSVSIITTSVYNMTQETLKVEVLASFELLDETNVTEGTYSKLSSFLDGSGIDIIIIYNNERYDDNGRLTPYETPLSVGMQDDFFSPYIRISDDDTWDTYGPSGSLVFNSGDTFEILYEVTTPPQLTGITATLILLTPLIFAGGVLAYLLNKQNY